MKTTKQYKGKEKQECYFPCYMDHKHNYPNGIPKAINEQGQESGRWEERLNKEFEMEQILIPITARKMKKFVKKELQEAERRRYEFARNEMIEDMEAVEEFFATAPIDYDDRKNMWIFLLNKLLDK